MRRRERRAPQKKELAERYLLRQRFWAELLERAKGRTSLHAGISPSQSNWIGAGAGRRGLSYNYVIRQHEAAAELYIDRGSESDEENRRIFEEIRRHQSSIEASFGGTLEWDCVEGRRACRIPEPLSRQAGTVMPISGPGRKTI